MKDKIVQWCERIIEWSLYVLVFGVTFSNAITEVAAGIAITTWIFKKIINREFKIVHTDLNYAIFGFFVVNLISLINVINTDYAFVSIKGFIGKITEYVLLYFVIVESIRTKKQFRNIIGVVLFTCLLIGIDGIFQKFFGFDFMRGRKIFGPTRLTASFKSPNHFGGWLSMVLPITMSLFLFGPKRRKWLRRAFGMLSTLLFICLLLAGSRAAWLGFVGAFLLMGVLKRQNLFLVSIVCIALICILLLSFTLPEKLLGEMSSIFYVTKNTMMDRIILWKETLPMIKDRPLLGHGVNSFMSNWSNYGVGETFGHPYYPHNCYLHMTAETGLIGLGMFIWIIIMLFKSTIKFLKKIKVKTEEDSFYQAVGIGLLAGITACLINSFVDNNLYVVLLATFFWVLLGLVNAEKRIYEDSIS